MKKIFLMTIAALAMGATANAQETYESATVADKDLNGTARYVGMGGAMEALGAEITTMGTNPAGTALFRKSQAVISGGFQSVNSAQPILGNKTTVSFDNIGFVIATPSGENTYINAGVSYRKSKNFNQILQAANRLSGASMNKLSYLKGYYDIFYPDFDKNGNVIGWENEKSDYTSNMFTQADYLFYNNFITDFKTYDMTYENADGFETEHASRGYISDFDFNLSANFNNRVYAGLTFGVSDVRYTTDSRYTEFLESGKTLTLDDYRHITGTGVTIKAGLIVRPFDELPLRIGGYMHTPTWYKLSTENFTTLSYNGLTPMKCKEIYDFRLNTPWTFGASLGHTIGRAVALGATYEYSDYSKLDNRIIDGSWIDYDGREQFNSHSDVAMNAHTSKALKGVHTVKVGAEVKLSPSVSARVGYNYVSPKFNYEKTDICYKDGTINSYGTFYQSDPSYTNWKATNRYTCGLGYTSGSFFADVAYQYSKTDGEYFPFMSVYSDDLDDNNNICDATKVSDKRHRVVFTIGYRF